MMGDRVIERMYSHASKTYPEECCGFIRDTCAGPEAIPVKNVHEMPRRNFRVDPADYAIYGGGAICMYHSHPDGEPRASDSDKEVHRITNLPQVVLNWPHGRLSTYGVIRAPLVGRPFIYGVFDCYSLVCSYYAKVYGIELKDFPRPRYGWWDAGKEDPFFIGYPSAGFREVTRGIEPGDLALTRLAGSNKAVHIGVMTEDNKMLHHRLNSFSCEVQYDGYYRDNTVMVLRYDH